MVVEKSNILKILSKAKTLYVADYNDTYGVSANMIKKLFQFGDYGKPLNLGLIVLEEFEEDGYIVVEGIQKLVTLCLIMFALCECYKQTNMANEEAISKIYERYLLGKYGVKLNLNNENKNIYEKIIYKERLTPEEKENPLFIVLHQFWQEIKDKGISANELYRALKSIECYVMKIKHGEGVEVYYLLNKNSRWLNTPKLIRSYLHKAEPSLTYIWDDMVQTYFESGIYNMFSPFLRDFLSIQNTKLRVHETEIFPIFVAYYEDLSKHRSPEQILTNLREFSERYLRMIKVDFEYFDIKKNFTRINEIGGQVAYPYLLEVLTDYDNGIISTDALNIILKTVFDYLNKGNEFDFTILSELINQRLVIRNL